MKTLFLFFSITFSLTAKSQLFSSKELTGKIVMIKDNDELQEKTATGFILTDNDSYFMVTAKHVGLKINVATTQLCFSESSKVAKYFDLGKFLSKGVFSGYNDKSDCFILKLDPFNEDSETLLKKTAMYVGMVSNERETLTKDFDVLVMGYPFYNLNNFVPFAFKANVSSPLLNFQMDSLSQATICYTIDHPSLQGTSGAPVFISVKDRCSLLLDKTLIVGIVSGGAKDNNGIDHTVVTPSFQLWDLIYGR